MSISKAIFNVILLIINYLINFDAFFNLAARYKINRVLKKQPNDVDKC
ncbi:MAG: hypothetical protein IPK08_23490 [Bacteroidetes bacterium]|nr:hypothetical protein [Bacteroidota bacterium]